MNDPISIVVADSAPVYRQAIRLVTNEMTASIRLIETASWKQLEQCIHAEQQIDLLIVDLALVDLDYFSQLQQLITSCSAPVAVTVDTVSSRWVRTLREIGVSALLCKSLSVQHFSDSLQDLLSGQRGTFSEHIRFGQSNYQHQEFAFLYLSKSELKVIKYLRKGWRNWQIAKQLNLAESTVKAHLISCFRKLGVINRTQLVALALLWPSLAWR